ncbi:hypothetical protein KFL_002390080 [Klebsormidium nitens]|uniref:Uncharacterized protein n=1 Tax=Klebsormidium nitens TaxID=105231 RepID=A0A1Y1I9Z7_KLENI|nr:hypothetical protein KFL_002390080 [Klebsormidium nitens]|eukprot:GAQ85516.1 hypothetical protein KFL_002390080 [Klebsormidium nitens]
MTSVRQAAEKTMRKDAARLADKGARIPAEATGDVLCARGKILMEEEGPVTLQTKASHSLSGVYRADQRGQWRAGELSSEAVISVHGQMWPSNGGPSATRFRKARLTKARLTD